MAEPNPAAPGRLELVRRFVNTLDIEAGQDRLATTGGLVGWLRDADLLRTGQTANEKQRRHATAVREALRDLLRANHNDEPAPVSALAVLDRAARPLGLSFTASGGWTLHSTRGGIDGATGHLLTIVIEAMAEGTWRSLKVCSNGACEWAYYDRSRALSRKWCSMGICGNRAKQQIWRSRHA